MLIDWTADAWYLERVHYEEFGRKTQIVSPPEEKKKINAESIIESMERVEKRLAKRVAERDKSSGSD